MIDESAYRNLRQYLMNRFRKYEAEYNEHEHEGDTYAVGYSQGWKHGIEDAILLLDDFWEGRLE